MLELPDLGVSNCLMLSACGQLDAPSKDDQTVLRKLKKWTIARAKDVYIAILGEPSGHFHIDVVASKVFKGDRGLKPNCSIREAKSIVGQLYGSKLETSFSATFTPSLRQLPPICQKQIQKVQSGGVTIETSGGKLRVSGAPFDLITWWIRADGEVRLQIQSHGAVVLGDEYLLSAYLPLESGFNAFISEGNSDVAQSK